MVDIESIRAHQRAFLEKEKARQEPVTYTIQGVEIMVSPGVFSPATDTKLLAAYIQTGPTERTLDLTTGSGVFSVIAGLQGVTGIAVDVNPKAVENAEENFERTGVRMQAIQSDLFANIPDERFDQMFANGPFFEGDITDPLDYACYGARRFVDNLFSGVRTRLKPSGKLLIVMSEWSDLKHFDETARYNGLGARAIATRSSDDGERTYHLHEVTSVS